MKKFRSIICVMLTLLLTLSSISCFAGEIILGPANERISYICSFDIEIDSTFSKHPIYRYVEDGILHVAAYAASVSAYFEFGDKDRIVFEAGGKTNGAWGVKGEWVVSGKINYTIDWEKIGTVQYYGHQYYQLEQCYAERLDTSLGNASTPSLGIDMIEDEDGLTIQMYLYDPNETSLAGVVKPLSTVAEYIPSSFREDRVIEKDGNLAGRTLFKRNGEYANAIEGTEEAAALEQAREEFLATLVDYTPTPVISFDPNELEEPEPDNGHPGTKVEEEPADEGTETDPGAANGTEDEPKEETPVEPTEPESPQTPEVPADTTPEDQPEPDRADALQQLGLLRGTGDGYALDADFTRAQGAAMLVRLLGKEQEALSLNAQGVFADVPAEDWSVLYVEYCYINGVTKGTDEDTYSPEDAISGSEYLTLVLRALGYNAVEPENADNAAADCGLTDRTVAEEICQTEALTRDTMVYISYQALTVKDPYGVTLIEKLAEAQAVDTSVAKALGLMQ